PLPGFSVLPEGRFPLPAGSFGFPGQGDLSVFSPGPFLPVLPELLFPAPVFSVPPKAAPVFLSALSGSPVPEGNPAGPSKAALLSVPVRSVLLPEAFLPAVLPAAGLLFPDCRTLSGLQTVLSLLPVFFWSPEASGHPSGTVPGRSFLSPSSPGLSPG